MAKYRYFTLEEFLRSDKAKAEGIDNTPSFEVVDNINSLVENILEPLRAAYGKPIIVNSGYRSPALNKAVGGANGSAHMRGDAADIRAADMPGFKKFVLDFLDARKIKFDQCILEKSPRSEWIHIAIKNAYGHQRCDKFSLTTK